MIALHLRSPAGAARAELGDLERELVLDAIGGVTVETTARRLNYSPSYLYAVRSRLLARMGASSMTGAVAVALRRGLVI